MRKIEIELKDDGKQKSEFSALVNINTSVLFRSSLNLSINVINSYNCICTVNPHNYNSHMNCSKSSGYVVWQ